MQLIENHTNKLHLVISTTPIDCFVIRRTWYLRKSEKLSRTQGLPEKGALVDDRRFHATHAELRGVHEKGPRLQQQGPFQLCYSWSAEKL